MANYQIAEGITGRNEGGYANDPADNGGETYAGIARKFWPKWAGWNIIDKIKAEQGKTAKIINLYAKADTTLHNLITKFYKNNFWDVNKLDLFEDQQLANSVYDFGVNAGTKKAAKVLQEVLEISADGIIGTMTLKAVNSGDPSDILETYNLARELFYRKLASNPTQAKFLTSWLRRLKPYA